jgi:hypothetical protein
MAWSAGFWGSWTEFLQAVQAMASMKSVVNPERTTPGHRTMMDRDSIGKSLESWSKGLTQRQGANSEPYIKLKHNNE